MKKEISVREQDLQMRAATSGMTLKSFLQMKEWHIPPTITGTGK